MRFVPPLAQLTSILSIGSLCAAADPPSGLDFELCQDHLVVIEGSVGRMEDLRFLVDTGATRTRIDDRVARHLGLGLVGPPRPFAALSGRGHAYGVVLPSIQFGPIRVGRVSSLATDLPDIFGCGRVDAILGSDLLRQRSFEIDYKRRRLTFGRVPDQRPSLPLATVVPLLSVEVTIDGRPFRLMLDTAASNVVLYPNRLRARLPKFRIRGRKEVSLATGRSTVTEVDLPDVRLGSTPWPGRAYLVDVTSEAYDGVDGVLGGAGAALERMAFDFETSRLRWREK